MSKQSDTPETDAMTWKGHCGDGDWGNVVYSNFARKLERERNEWKAKYIQQNKDLGCELRDPNGTIWDHAKRLQAELDEARRELAQIESLMFGGFLQDTPEDGLAWRVFNYARDMKRELAAARQENPLRETPDKLD